MMDKILDKIQQHKRLTLFLITIVAFAVIGFSVYSMSNSNDTDTPTAEPPNQSSDNSAPKYIYVTNSDAVKEIPEMTRDKLARSLYEIIQKNNPDIDVASVSDAVVRDKSLVDEYKSQLYTHYGNYIVDIPSLRQSYAVHYEWSSVYTDKFFSGYPLISYCLEPDKLIYDDFNCRDDFGEAM